MPFNSHITQALAQQRERDLERVRGYGRPPGTPATRLGPTARWMRGGASAGHAMGGAAARARAWRPRPRLPLRSSR
jgi:hypothetical protein